MLNFLKNLFKTSKPEVPIKVPFHIQQVAKLYPIVHILDHNKAKGDIKILTTDKDLRIGQALILNRNKEIWVHLGNQYYKNIFKA